MKKSSKSILKQGQIDFSILTFSFLILWKRFVFVSDVKVYQKSCPLKPNNDRFNYDKPPIKKMKRFSVKRFIIFFTLCPTYFSVHFFLSFIKLYRPVTGIDSS